MYQVRRARQPANGVRQSGSVGITLTCCLRLLTLLLFCLLRSSLSVCADSASWHADYRSSAYIFIGGLSPELSEGDVIVLFSQFGEVVDLHLPRRASVDPSALGARLGFAFLAFEDQRSTVLAIDNMNGWEMKLPGETRPRFLRVDHAGKYRRPKGAAGSAAAGAEEKTFDDVETNDAAYDERRRKIWDYAKYGTLDDGRRRTLAVGELPDFDGLTSAAASAAAGPARAAHVDASDSREDAKHADRVMAMLAEKKKQRERARMGGDEQQSGGGGAGAAAAAASSSSYSAPAAASRGTTVGVDGQRRFGDQIVSQPSAAVASSSSSSARRSHSSRSPRRSSHSHRDREHKHKSRSRSRERKKDRKRSRSRDRESSRR